MGPAGTGACNAAIRRRSVALARWPLKAWRRKHGIDVDVDEIVIGKKFTQVLDFFTSRGLKLSSAGQTAGRTDGRWMGS